MDPERLPTRGALQLAPAGGSVPSTIEANASLLSTMEEASGFLFSQCWWQLFALLHHQTHDLFLAEDVASDAMGKVTQRLPALLPIRPSSLRAYYFTAGINLFRNHRRRPSSQVSSLDAAGRPNDDDDCDWHERLADSSSWSDLGRTETRLAVESAFRRSFGQRAEQMYYLLKLKYIDGLESAEIAAKFQVMGRGPQTVGAVDAAASRACKALRDRGGLR